METNNREFIYLRNKWIIILLVNMIVFYFVDSKFILFIIVLISLTFLYFQSYQIISKLFTDMRNVIAYASQDQEMKIEDGDLGLLYDEMRNLKKRSKAYEVTIHEEKNKLRKTIEDICHQLKTPLTSISIYNELLLNENETDENVVETQKQIEKMKYLINSLLKLAKLQSHQVVFEFEYLPVKDLIDLSLQSLHSLIEISQVEFIVHDTHISFYYDEDWLQEALSNIVKNALEQDCTIIDISFEEHSNYIKIYIYNNGSEMNEKDLPHIFERFYHTSHQNGVGIGLALSKEIIERHHGYIEAYNHNGVVFEMMFPKYKMKEKVS